jgi:hypothetical protein
MKSILVLLSVLALTLSVVSQHAQAEFANDGTDLKKDLNFYLPNEEYNAAIPTPESVLGYQVGEWHIRHDQLVSYFKALAAASDRVSVKVIGRTHQHRELLHVYITHPDRHNRIDEIKQKRAQFFTQKGNTSEDPLIVNLNYSVHGDESSGSNASVLVAYYLAASNSEKVQTYLKDMVIVMDPSLNPDGLSRFALWANQHKGKNINKDPMNREHLQPWVRGRVNQYWFDLNRDWLLLQHPESRARIAEYQQWRPHVLTDHHEMGKDSTFFFQPGIPSRKNPLTPKENVSLTKKLAMFHAKAFDAENKVYFSEEAFDDFYAGKGSTYPDLHGSIGILFEQASSRGHIQESINGDLEFPTTIRHQVMSSLSTLAGSLAHSSELKAFQQDFKKEAKALAKDADHDGYILSERNDKTRFDALLDLMSRHKINAYPLLRDATIDGRRYNKEDSVYVPLDQPQARLIESIFSTQKSFEDNTFYDVSSWNLGYAFDIAVAKVESDRKLRIAKKTWSIEDSASAKRNDEAKAVAQSMLVDSPYSVAIRWHDMNSPALVNRLLTKGLDVRAVLSPITAQTEQGPQQFAAGTMLVNAIQQPAGWQQILVDAIQDFPVELAKVTTGFTSHGVDLGSRRLLKLKAPKVLIVGGRGTSPYEVGEAWYMLDRWVGFSPTIVEKHNLNYVTLADYTHVVMVDGSYSKQDEGFAKKLKEFARQGGTIWGQKRAAIWLAKQEILQAETITQSEMYKRFDTEGLKFGEKEALGGRQRIAGAFFESKLDVSNPLAFGLNDSRLPLFKNRTDLLLKSEKAFSHVATYVEKPLMSGYADDKNIEKISNASGVIAHRLGRGTVIGMTDNPNFRAIMYGSSRFFFNSLFLSRAL